MKKGIQRVAEIGILASILILGVGMTDANDTKTTLSNVAPVMDGTETLGDPSIAIASGTGFVAGGVGMDDVQPGVISLDVPVGATIRQVLVYWGGATAPRIGQPAIPGDDEILLDGVAVTGTLIGGPSFFFRRQGADFYYSNFRADITALGIVTTGANSISVDELNFKNSEGVGENSGVGILVIIDDGGTQSTVAVKDGLDLAYFDFPEPRQTTVAQSFAFAPAPYDRVADFALFAGSVGAEDRTSIIRITPDAGAVQDLVNVLGSNDGNLWDTVTIPVDIPAGATSVTIQIISGDGTDIGRGASLDWVGAGLAVPVVETGGGCSYTQGYWRTHNPTFGARNRGKAPAPDPTWTLIGDSDGDGVEEAELETFFLSGLTWYEAIWQPIRGNQYFNLSQQWIAAYLNSLSGADVTAIAGELAAGQTLFETYAPGDVNRTNRRQFTSLAETLKDYNEGRIGPGHCDSQVEDGEALNKKLRSSGIATNEIPAVLTIESAYPNPFRERTQIRINVVEATAVSVVVYDVLGRAVRTLADAQFDAGLHEVSFEAGDLPQGTYYYRIDTEYGSATGNIVLKK